MGRIGALAMVLAACGASGCARAGASARAHERPRRLVLLHTSDLHAHLLPRDELADRDDPTRSFAKIATLVRAVRAAEPCTMLLDSGDTLQGDPQGAWIARAEPDAPHPMAAAMSALGYDAMAVGNHDFDFGERVLARFRRGARFPVLAANVRALGEAPDAPSFAPSTIIERCGVTVGIIGAVTVGTKTWEPPDNVRGLAFDAVEPAVRREVTKLRAAGAELVVVLLHGGPDRVPKLPPGQRLDDHLEAWGADVDDASRWSESVRLPSENEAVAVARVPGVDVVLSGHTHLAIPAMHVGRAVIEQPGARGSHLGVVEITFPAGVDAAESARGRAIESRLRRPDERTPADPEIVAIATPSADASRASLSQPLGTALDALPSGMRARLEDSALADWIHQVQRDAARHAGFSVDASTAAIFGNGRGIDAGIITARDVFRIYPYDNTLWVKSLTGEQVRAALEHDASYFATIDPRAVPTDARAVKANPDGPDFNWDSWDGLEIELDLTRPIGRRVRQLRRGDHALRDDEVLTVVMSSYRAGGGGGYSTLAAGRTLWSSNDGVRDMLTAWLAEHRTLASTVGDGCHLRLSPDLYAAVFPNEPRRCPPIR